VDAFEQLVSEILWMEGYWVRTSVKVELTKEEKKIDWPPIVTTMGTRHRCVWRPRQRATGC